MSEMKSVVDNAKVEAKCKKVELDTAKATISETKRVLTEFRSQLKKKEEDLCLATNAFNCDMKKITNDNAVLQKKNQMHPYQKLI